MSSLETVIGAIGTWVEGGWGNFTTFFDTVFGVFKDLVA